MATTEVIRKVTRELSDGGSNAPLSNEAVRLLIWMRQTHRQERAAFDTMREYAEVLRKENLILRSEERGKHGNPALMGMCGFATCCFLLQMTNLGVMGSGPVVYVGLTFGCFCLFMAGLQELWIGSIVRATGFCTFSSFWFCIVLIKLGNSGAAPVLLETESAWVVAMIACIIAILWVAWFHHSLIMTLMFTSLLAGYIVTDVANFGHLPRVRMVAGWILLISAFCAYYTVAHILLHDVFGREILPLLPNLETIARRVFRCGLDTYIPRHKSSLVYEFATTAGVLHRLPVINHPPPRKFGVG